MYYEKARKRTMKTMKALRRKERTPKRKENGDEYLEQRTTRAESRRQNGGGRNLDAGDLVYIVTPDGRDGGTTNEESPDRTTWKHPGHLSF